MSEWIDINDKKPLFGEIILVRIGFDNPMLSPGEVIACKYGPVNLRAVTSFDGVPYMVIDLTKCEWKHTPESDLIEHGRIYVESELPKEGEE